MIEKGNHVSERLYNYLVSEILVLYDNLDEAHNTQHIKNVMNRSIRMADELKVDKDILLVGAAYHDVGMIFGRRNHEKNSVEFFRQDKFVKKFFFEEELKIISNAIEDHRATNIRKPRSIYGEILHDVDTFGGDYNELIIRSIGYGKKFFPQYTKHQHFERIYGYLEKKYGEHGYAKLYIDYAPHQLNFSGINQILKSPRKVQSIFEKFF